MDISYEKTWIKQTLLDDRLSDGTKLALIVDLFNDVVRKIEEVKRLS